MQYADDSTLYQSCKINQKDTCIKELEKDLNSIAKWSIETNLVFNTGKNKTYAYSIKTAVSKT